MFFPYITGDWTARTSTGTSARAAASRSRSPGCTSCAGRPTGSRSSPPSPRSSTTPSATRRGRCASARCSASRSTRCCPSASAARWARQAVADDPTFIAFYTQAFDELVGNCAGQRDDLLRRRGPRAVDEHGDDGRLQGAVRHLQGRDDDQRARGAQPLPRAGAGDDARRAAEHPPHHVLRRRDGDPGGQQRRLRVRHLRGARRLPAAAQGPARTGRGRCGCPTTGCRSARCCSPSTSVLLIAGGFIWSGGFLGIEGYGYGWDKTRVGLLVLVCRAGPVRRGATCPGQVAACACARRSRRRRRSCARARSWPRSPSRPEQALDRRDPRGSASGTRSPGRSFGGRRSP